MRKPREFRTTRLDVTFVEGAVDAKGRIVLLGPHVDRGKPRLRIQLEISSPYILQWLHRRVVERADQLRQGARSHIESVERSLNEIPTNARKP